MNQTTLTKPTGLKDFGTPTERVEKAIAALREGQGIIVVDDEDRENEGDLIYAAETVTVEQMALLIREGTGIVCLSLPEERLRALDLPQMVSENTAFMSTAFTVSIDAHDNITTGVSAADRVETIRTAIDPASQPDDLARPGHVFPLQAHPGGVKARRGHTEASIEFVTMAGLKPAAVICELMNPDGTMMRLPELMLFARDHGLPLVSIEDLVDYLSERETAAA